jgi:hypothetical protein
MTRAMAGEALAFHVEGMVADGEAVPESSNSRVCYYLPQREDMEFGNPLFPVLALDTQPLRHGPM